MERVKASGVKVSKTPCYDIIRILASGLVARLQGITLAWYQLWNPARSACTHGRGEWGMQCAVCVLCNKKMTSEMAYNEWVNPGPTAKEKRSIQSVPPTINVTHTLFQCYFFRRAVQDAAKERADLAWMLIEMDAELVQRILVAALIYQERH